MRKTLFVLACAAVLAPVVAAGASKVVVPGDKSGAVVINQGDYDDLYTGGGSVLVGLEFKVQQRSVEAQLSQCALKVEYD